MGNHETEENKEKGGDHNRKRVRELCKRTVVEPEEGTESEIEMGNKNRTQREGGDESDLERTKAAMNKAVEEICWRLRKDL